MALENEGNYHFAKLKNLLSDRFPEQVRMTVVHNSMSRQIKRLSESVRSHYSMR